MLRCSKILPFIYLLALFPIFEYITDSKRDQLPDGLIAQLVEHCTDIADVMGTDHFIVVRSVN